jgi:hypothetical protein
MDGAGPVGILERRPTLHEPSPTARHTRLWRRRGGRGRSGHGGRRHFLDRGRRLGSQWAYSLRGASYGWFRRRSRSAGLWRGRRALRGWRRRDRQHVEGKQRRAPSRSPCGHCRRRSLDGAGLRDIAWTHRGDEVADGSREDPGGQGRSRCIGLRCGFKGRQSVGRAGLHRVARRHSPRGFGGRKRLDCRAICALWKQIHAVRFGDILAERQCQRVGKLVSRLIRSGGKLIWRPGHKGIQQVEPRCFVGRQRHVRLRKG